MNPDHVKWMFKLTLRPFWLTLWLGRYGLHLRRRLDHPHLFSERHGPGVYSKVIGPLRLTLRKKERAS